MADSPHDIIENAEKQIATVLRDSDKALGRYGLRLKDTTITFHETRDIGRGERYNIMYEVGIDIAKGAYTGEVDET